MGEVVSSTRNEREVNLTRGLSRLQKITKLCSFYDPLVNQSIPLNCSSKSFVSIVRSRCKTRLGNQLSSYAAVLYFQKKYGMVPLMDNFQMRIIKSVFEEENLSVKSLGLDTCCKSRRLRKSWKKVKPLKEDKRTGVATGLNERFSTNPDFYLRNFMVDLGSHTMPVFLFKDILPELKKEFVFRPRISRLARDMLNQIIDDQAVKNLIFVGIHARRGDRIRKWQKKDDVQEQQCCFCWKL